MNQCRQRGKRWKDLFSPGFLTQTKLKVAAELRGWLRFVPVDLHSSTRLEGEKVRACEEEMQSKSTPGEMHIRQKEKVGMPVVRERAAVERGMCETERESR